MNHKYNKDGRCNFAWNLEWVTDSENTLHGLYFSDKYTDYTLDPNIILDRKEKYISYDQNGEDNPKSRISEFQAHLICYAYTVLNYSIVDCARYAWLDGNEKDAILVSSIVNGYSWNHIGVQYGITPKPKRININRASPIRPEKEQEYISMRKEKRR